jgi:hypothetical protein
MTATMEANLVQKFSNGARIVEFSEGVQVGIDQVGSVYWATPEGWDFVLEHPELFQEKCKSALCGSEFFARALTVDGTR